MSILNHKDTFFVTSSTPTKESVQNDKEAARIPRTYAGIKSESIEEEGILVDSFDILKEMLEVLSQSRSYLTSIENNVLINAILVAQKKLEATKTASGRSETKRKIFKILSDIIQECSNINGSEHVFSYKNEDGLTALHELISFGDTWEPIIKQVLLASPQICFIPDSKGQFPLALAADVGAFRVFRTLAQYEHPRKVWLQCSQAYKNKNGLTILHKLISFGDEWEPIIKKVLQVAPELCSICDLKGQFPLGLAADIGAFDVFMSLVHYEDEHPQKAWIQCLQPEYQRQLQDCSKKKVIAFVKKNADPNITKVPCLVATHSSWKNVYIVLKEYINNKKEDSIRIKEIIEYVQPKLKEDYIACLFILVSLPVFISLKDQLSILKDLPLDDHIEVLKQFAQFLGIPEKEQSVFASLKEQLSMFKDLPLDTHIKILEQFAQFLDIPEKKQSVFSSLKEQLSMFKDLPLDTHIKILEQLAQFLGIPEKEQSVFIFLKEQLSMLKDFPLDTHIEISKKLTQFLDLQSQIMKWAPDRIMINRMFRWFSPHGFNQFNQLIQLSNLLGKKPKDLSEKQIDQMEKKYRSLSEEQIQQATRYALDGYSFDSIAKVMNEKEGSMPLYFAYLYEARKIIETFIREQTAKRYEDLSEKRIKEMEKEHEKGYKNILEEEVKRDTQSALDESSFDVIRKFVDTKKGSMPIHYAYFYGARKIIENFIIRHATQVALYGYSFGAITKAIDVKRGNTLLHFAYLHEARNTIEAFLKGIGLWEWNDLRKLYSESVDDYLKKNPNEYLQAALKLENKRGETAYQCSDFSFADEIQEEVVCPILENHYMPLPHPHP